jgi:Fur family transcriptional regulator, ferric uptake regulator
MQKAPAAHKVLLRTHGLRATPGRIAILQVLEKATKPLTVAELHAKVGSKSVDQVTLYRTLETFVSLHLARRIDLHQGRAHSYELVGEHHHHLICTQCGMVKDFEACDIDKVVDQALRQVQGFASVNDHAFELFGMCNRCAETNNN